MFLFIHSQDMGKVCYGIATNTQDVVMSSYEVSPEQNLATLDRFIKDHNMILSDVRGIVVVTGPGSFTASRLSVTMANTFAFVLSTPISGVENKDQRSSREIFLAWLTSVHDHPQTFVTPTYQQPPHITSPAKKDLHT